MSKFTFLLTHRGGCQVRQLTAPAVGAAFDKWTSMSGPAPEVIAAFQSTLAARGPSFVRQVMGAWELVAGPARLYAVQHEPASIEIYGSRSADPRLGTASTTRYSPSASKHHYVLLTTIGEETVALQVRAAAGNPVQALKLATRKMDSEPMLAPFSTCVLEDLSNEDLPVLIDGTMDVWFADAVTQDKYAMIHVIEQENLG